MTGIPKSAVCRVSAEIFYLVDADKGISVYAGRLSHPFFDRESGDTVKIADFSDFNTSGRYFIRAGYRRSDIFQISAEPYKNIRHDILSGMYLNRCGFDFYDFSDDARSCPEQLRHKCHTEPVALCSDPSKMFDVKGGWHNSGSYDKDVYNTGLTIAYLLYSLVLFCESFDRNERLLIEDECRWGLDWLLKMQDTDGGVFAGVCAATPSASAAPDEDEAQYTLAEKTCTAALCFTAVTALAASYFGSFDREYSCKLKRASSLSWLSIVRTPEYCYYTGKNGSYSEYGDGGYSLESQFMWAMCEMYSLTGEESFADMIGKKYSTSSFTGFGKNGCGVFAALSYFLSHKKKNRIIDSVIRKHLTDHADRMYFSVKGSGYRTARGADMGYGYGSNFGVLNDCMEFIAAYLVSGEQKYLLCATEQFSYIFGKNPMGKSYITGSGEEYIQHPCHSLSLYYESVGPVKGMIVSGPNSDRTDEYTKWHLEKGAPAAKCYMDNEYSLSTNEPAVHFSAPVIFISAFYDKVGRSALSGHHGSISPLPANLVLYS